MAVFWFLSPSHWCLSVLSLLYQSVMFILLPCSSGGPRSSSFCILLFAVYHWAARHKARSESSAELGCYLYFIFVILSRITKLWILCKINVLRYLSQVSTNHLQYNSPWKLCKPCYPINNVDFILLLICKEMYGEKLFSGISLDVIPLVILNLQSLAHY